MVVFETGSHFITMVASFSLSLLLSAGVTVMCHHTWLPAMTSVLSPLTLCLRSAPQLGICIMFGTLLASVSPIGAHSTQVDVGLTNMSSLTVLAFSVGLSALPHLFLPHVSPVCVSCSSPLCHACPLSSLCFFEHSLPVFLFLSRLS